MVRTTVSFFPFSSGKDIFSLDKIIFPINQGQMHWVCAVAYMQEKRVQFYDSMGADGMHYLEAILHYIKDEHQDKKKSPLPDADEWRLVCCTNDTPQQRNGKRLFLSLVKCLSLYASHNCTVSLLGRVRLWCIHLHVC